jgi:hypothetical protein
MPPMVGAELRVTAAGSPSATATPVRFPVVTVTFTLGKRFVEGSDAFSTP